MYSVVTGFHGWCIHDNLFVWIVYPWKLVVWMVYDTVSMVTDLCGWCMRGSCCDYLVLLWLCLCNILYQILFDVNNVFNDPDSMFYQKLVNKLSLCQICFVYFSLKSTLDDLFRLLKR